MRSILRSRNKLRRAKSASKITISEREIKRTKRVKVKAKETKVKARETKVEARTIEKSTKVDAKANATIATIATTTTTNKKRLLKSCEQFICTHVSVTTLARYSRYIFYKVVYST